MKKSNFIKKLPSNEGVYKMKEGRKTYIIFIEKIGSKLGFRVKGIIGIYDLNTVKHCSFKKVTNYD